MLFPVSGKHRCFSLLQIVFTPALGPAQVPIYPSSFSNEVSRPGVGFGGNVNLISHLYIVSMLGMSGAIPMLPTTPSWRGPNFHLCAFYNLEVIEIFLLKRPF